MSMRSLLFLAASWLVLVLSPLQAFGKSITKIDSIGGQSTRSGQRSLHLHNLVLTKIKAVEISPTECWSRGYGGWTMDSLFRCDRIPDFTIGLGEIVFFQLRYDGERNYDVNPI